MTTDLNLLSKLGDGVPIGDSLGFQLLYITERVRQPQLSAVQLPLETSLLLLELLLLFNS